MSEKPSVFFDEDLHLVANELSILAVGTEPARQDKIRAGALKKRSNGAVVYEVY